MIEIILAVSCGFFFGIVVCFVVMLFLLSHSPKFMAEEDRENLESLSKAVSDLRKL